MAARKNGAKVIVIDPRQSSTAAMADEWIPINPQTDPALALGMMNSSSPTISTTKRSLLPKSVAPYLIRDDNGAYLRNAEGAYLVWDESTNTVVAAPTAEEVRAGGVMPALSGSFNVEGVACKTAFDHLAESAKNTLRNTRQSLRHHRRNRRAPRQRIHRGPACRYPHGSRYAARLAFLRSVPWQRSLWSPATSA